MAKAAMKGHRLRKDLLEDFVSSSYRVWGSRFDYSIMELKHPNVPVKVICKHHGVFPVTPRDHIHMQKGCPECSTERRVRKQVTQANLPPSPELKELMVKLSPGRMHAIKQIGDPSEPKDE